MARDGRWLGSDPAEMSIFLAGICTMQSAPRGWGFIYLMVASDGDKGR